MALIADVARARTLADRLYRMFAVTGKGIHGQTTMLEGELPEGVSPDSLEHLLFVTFTVAIKGQSARPVTLHTPRLCLTPAKSRFN